MKSSELWTKDFILDAIVNFLLYVIFYQLMLLSTDIALQQFHASISGAGLASGIFIIGALVSRITSGRYIDVVGRKKMLLLGTTLYLLSMVFYYMISSLSFFYIIRFIHGISYGIASTAASTIVASLVPLERRGEGLGYYALSLALASAIGPFLGIMFSQSGHYDWSLWLCTVLAVLTVVLSFFIHSPEHQFTEKELDTLHHVTLSSFFAAKALPISFICLFCGIGYSTVLSFIGAYTHSINMAEAGSLFFVCYAVTSLLSRPVLGRLLDSHGGDIIMYPTLFLLAMSMFTLAFASSDWMLLLSGLLLGISYGTITSTGQALAIHRISAYQIGLATSTLFIFLDIGVGIGPYLLGSLVPIYGFSSVYLTAGIIALADIFLYYLLLGRSGIFSKSQMALAKES